MSTACNICRDGTNTTHVPQSPLTKTSTPHLDAKHSRPLSLEIAFLSGTSLLFTGLTILPCPSRTRSRIGNEPMQHHYDSRRCVAVTTAAATIHAMKNVE